MRKLTWVALVVVAVTLIPTFAAAENFYAAVRGGPGITSDTENGPASAAVRDREEYKVGLTGSGAVGYMFPFGLRAEGEFGFIYSPLKREGGVDIDGSVKSYLLMANAYYDLKLAALGGFKPYVGVGLGGARVNNDQQTTISFLGGRKVDVDTWRTAFAYQARAGVGYEISKLWDVTLGYRYVHIDSGHIDSGTRRIFLDEIRNHSVEIGFAIKF
jgi:opacity protein-like surface antigen